MHSKSGNIEIIINNEAEKLFKSLKKRHQNNLEKVEGSQVVFDYVHLLHCKCHKINPNCGGPYTDSPNLIKSKTTTINPINLVLSMHCNSRIKS